MNTVCMGIECGESKKRRGVEIVQRKFYMGFEGTKRVEWRSIVAGRPAFTRSSRSPRRSRVKVPQLRRAPGRKEIKIWERDKSW